MTSDAILTDNGNNSADSEQQRIVRAIFLLLGIGVLVPWNAFISSVEYFQNRICSLPPNYSKRFESWVGLLFNLSSVATLCILMVAWPWIQQQQKKWWSGVAAVVVVVADEDGRQDDRESIINGSGIVEERGNALNLDPDQAESTTPQSATHSQFFWLVTVPLFVFLAVFVGTDLLVLLPEIAPFAFLTMTLLGIILCGCAVALAQTGIVATASQKFPTGIAPFVAGQAIGGVLVSAANLASAAAGDPVGYWQKHCWSGGHNDTNNSSGFTNGTSSILQYEWVEDASAASDDPTCLPYEKPDWDVFVYFLLGSIVLLGCVIGFGMLERTSPQQQQYYNSTEYESVEAEAVADTEEAVILEEFHDEPPPTASNTNNTGSGLELSQHQNDEPDSNNNCTSATNTTVGSAVDTAITTPKTTTEGLVELQSYHHGDDNIEGSDDLLRHLPSRGSRTEGIMFDNTVPPEGELTFQNVLQAVKGPAFCIFFTFFVTLALFPSWTSHLRSIHHCQYHGDQSSSNTATSPPTTMLSRLQNDLFIPFTFLLFNVGDLGGRLLAGTVPVSRIRNMSAKLVMAACARCLFFPLLLLCVGGDDNHNSTVGDDDHDARVRIQSDLYSLVVQALLALSNGLLISLAFVHAPTLIHPAIPASQEKSSEILTFALSFGLLSGSLFAFPVTKMAMEL